MCKRPVAALVFLLKGCSTIPPIIHWKIQNKFDAHGQSLKLKDAAAPFWVLAEPRRWWPGTARMITSVGGAAFFENSYCGCELVLRSFRNVLSLGKHLLRFESKWTIFFSFSPKTWLLNRSALSSVVCLGFQPEKGFTATIPLMLSSSASLLLLFRLVLTRG